MFVACKCYVFNGFFDSCFGFSNRSMYMCAVWSNIGRHTRFVLLYTIIINGDAISMSIWIVEYSLTYIYRRDQMFYFTRNKTKIEEKYISFSFHTNDMHPIVFNIFLFYLSCKSIQSTEVSIFTTKSLVMSH